MKQYTIHCTPEQTRKALELGASIKANKDYSNGNLPETLCFYGDIINKDAYGVGECTILHIPTAEQMIGWLRKEHGIHPCINCEGSENYTAQLQFIHSAKDIDVENPNYKGIIGHKGYPSAPEATIAAIDAALEYLTKNKK